MWIFREYFLDGKKSGYFRNIFQGSIKAIIGNVLRNFPEGHQGKKYGIWQQLFGGNICGYFEDIFRRGIWATILDFGVPFLKGKLLKNIFQRALRAIIGHIFFNIFREPSGQ